jgi:hypothetical protein
LELFEYGDGALYWRRDDPGSRDPRRGALALEGRACNEVAVDACVVIALVTDASALQVFDYWWSGRIPNVRYSSA